MTREELNNSIDTVFDDTRADESLAPSMAGEKLKEVADYTDQEALKKVDKVAGKSLILDTEIARLASVTNQDISNFYTKPEVDAKVSSVYKYKGSVANYAALPSTGLIVGDVYNLLDTGANYVWTGTVWDELGMTIDVTGKEDITNKSTDGTFASNSDEKYPSEKAAKTYADSKDVDTAFVAKTYAATMSVAHDPKNPNFDISLTGNLDLTITGTSNGDSGLVNLYFSSTETATINGVKSLSITGDGEMIPVYFIHDTDGIKWYDAREAIPVDTSTLAIKEGTRLYHDLSSGYSQTMTNVGVNCVASFIDPATMVGWEIIKANGEKAVIASITNFTDFTTVEPFATDSVGIGITAKAPSIWVKSDGTITIYNKDGEVKISINADGSIKFGSAMTQLSNGNMSLSALWSFGEMFFDSATSSVHTPQYGSFNSGLGTNIDVRLQRYDAGVWAVLDGAGNPGNLRANKFLMGSNTTYANDAAADADATLLSGSFYMITGDRTIKRKP